MRTRTIKSFTERTCPIMKKKCIGDRCSFYMKWTEKKRRLFKKPLFRNCQRCEFMASFEAGPLLKVTVTRTTDPPRSGEERE